MNAPLPLVDGFDLGPEAELERLGPVPVPDGDPRPAPPERAVVWAAAAVLLGYPDAGLLAVLPELEALLRTGLPGTGPLAGPVTHLRGRTLLAAQQEYVATFDTRRRCCPYLTYYLHGDTRRRGLALWRVKTALRACGVEPAGGELPDHLAVVSELAATGDESVAVRLLAEHRAGLELLRAALQAARSPYAGAVEAVAGLLPPADATAARAAAAALAASGPPAETVGLPGRLNPFLPVGPADPARSADDRGARR